MHAGGARAYAHVHLALPPHAYAINIFQMARPALPVTRRLDALTNGIFDLGYSFRNCKHKVVMGSNHNIAIGGCRHLHLGRGTVAFAHLQLMKVQCWNVLNLGGAEISELLGNNAGEYNTVSINGRIWHVHLTYTFTLMLART